MKKVLITGADSYIGTSVEKWLIHHGSYQIHTLDMRNPSWETQDFSNYDTIFHVAGIAHFSKDDSQKDLYYRVNTELPRRVALKAKKEGVAQFIFMSSIIVYGDSTTGMRVIKEDTFPSPTDFYGDSKWQAEQALHELASQEFKIAIVRPPMIYGKHSKGNYPRLATLAQRTPIFPNFANQRSMLHIDNLSAFIQGLIDGVYSGVFFPQNKEYVSTANLVAEIANVHGKKIHFTPIFNPLIRLLFGLDTIKKVFGNLVYEKTMSQYAFDYQVRGFEESVRLTEKE